MLRFPARLAPFLALALLAACSSDVIQSSSGSASGSGSASSSGSSSGSGGGSGSGGAGGSGGGSVYSAHNLFTHVPRFVVFKADPARDVCFRFWLEGLGSPGALGIDVTAPWAVSRAEVTNHAVDCSVPNGYPMQPVDSADAASGTGTLVVEGGFPCSISLHGTLSFTPDPAKPWIPAAESFDVDALPVDGGCG